MKRYAPKGATHYRIVAGYVVAGGTSTITVRWFKELNGVFFYYRTDSDNEYPEWVSSSKHYPMTEKVIADLIPLESP